MLLFVTSKMVIDCVPVVCRSRVLEYHRTHLITLGKICTDVWVIRHSGIHGTSVFDFRHWLSVVPPYFYLAVLGTNEQVNVIIWKPCDSLQAMSSLINASRVFGASEDSSSSRGNIL